MLLLISVKPPVQIALIFMVLSAPKQMTSHETHVPVVLHASPIPLRFFSCVIHGLFHNNRWQLNLSGQVSLILLFLPYIHPGVRLI